MKAEVVKALLKALNSNNVEDAGTWIRASCPLARWKHKSGHDKNPSFGIKVDNVKPSHFNCWACNTGGPLELLMMEIMHLSKGDTHGLDIAEAFKLVDADELTGFHGSEWSEFEVSQAKDVFKPWDEQYLQSFIPATKVPAAMEYLKGRGIGIEMAQAFDIRYDSHRKTVAFPFRNFNQSLAGMRGRYINPTGDLRYHDYDWFDPSILSKVNNTVHTWFNEHKVDWERTIVLAEGAFDVVAIYNQYQNVISPLSTGMSYEKIDRLKQAVKIVCFFDNDLAGETAYQKIKKAVGSSTVVKKVTYPEGTPHGADADSIGQEMTAQLLNGLVKLNPLNYSK